MRVNLAAVVSGRISADALLAALIRSANTAPPADIGVWTERWHTILAVIESMGLALPDFAADREAIEQRLTQGIFMGHHSRRYNRAYSPHYRIVSRDIFFAEILPLLQ